MGRINTNRFIEACKDSAGIITVIAKRLSCSRKAVYDYTKREPNMKKYIEEAEDIALDMAESKIINSINLAKPEGSMDDVKWFLSRKGKERGWSERPNTEVNVNAKSEAMQVSISSNINEALNKARERWSSQEKTTS